VHFAGALVHARAKASPGDEVPVGLEAAHIDADLSDERRYTDLTQARDPYQSVDDVAKGLHRLLDFVVELLDRSLDGLDQVQVHAKETALLSGQSAMQRLYQPLALDAQARVSEIGQPLRIALAPNQSLDDGATAHAKHIRDRPCEFESGHVEGLLDALRVTGYFPHELFACARELAERLDGSRGDETAAHQAVRQ
jgi:hypothetical protein